MEQALQNKERIDLKGALLDQAKALDTFEANQPLYFAIQQHKMCYLKMPPQDIAPLVWKKPESLSKLGNEYRIKTNNPIDKSDYGQTMAWNFAEKALHYPAYWVNDDLARSFGVVWVRNGHYVEVIHPKIELKRHEYQYGVFAGYWHPYVKQPDQDRFKISNRIITDLECHDFPHVFESVDAKVPLVITVGRVDVKHQTLTVADLWVPCGTALYIPPRKALATDDYWYLHNNRNAAHACFEHPNLTEMTTNTVLQTEHSYSYWFWNDLRTEHELLNLPFEHLDVAQD